MKTATKPFRFRLYVAGTSPNSTLAVQNLRNLCQTYVPEAHEIEVIDVLQTPERALDDLILVTPTLVKLSPGSSKRLIGNLSATQIVLAQLGMETPA